MMLFTEYSLEWINLQDKEDIIRSFYKRITVFFDAIGGLRTTRDSYGKINSVGTFIPHNTVPWAINDSWEKCKTKQVWPYDTYL